MVWHQQNQDATTDLPDTFKKAVQPTIQELMLCQGRPLYGISHDGSFLLWDATHAGNSS